MAGWELKRITEDSHQMNTFSKPLASLDENTRDDFHVELHNSFNTAESRSLPYSYKRHADDSLVKATILWKPVGDDVKEEPNELRSFGTTGAYQQSRKSSTATNLYKKATYREKENLESVSGWARGSLEFSNQCTINAGLSGSSVDGKRLHEGLDAFSKPVTRLEIKAVDEVNEAVGGPGLNIGDGKPVNGCNARAQKVSAGPMTAILEKRCVYSQNRQPDFRPEDSLCFASDCSIQTSVIESREGAQPLIALVQENMKGTSQNLCLEGTISMKAPLLNRFHYRRDLKSSIFTQKSEVADSCLPSQLESPLKSTQKFEENVYDVSRLCHMTAKTPHGQFKAQNMGEYSMRSNLLTIPVFSESNIQSLQNAQTCEKFSTQDNDHFVVLFSEQKTSRRSAGRKIRQELLKLSSFCSQYSHKILSWVTCLATDQNIGGCLRRLRQIFSSPPRGFVNLDSHKMPEFSTKVTSLSSSRKLAKDKELKAVLTKINDVLVSMERTSPDSIQESNSKFIQESNPKFISHEAFKAAGSCSQHDCRAFAMIGA